MKTISPIAEMVDHPQDVADRRQTQAYGVVVHTTGSGVLAYAEKHGIKPIEAAISIYTRPGANFAHYCIDSEGFVIQIADEKELAPHAGIGKADRALYKNGVWRKKVSKLGLTLWEEKWGWRGRARSPLNLFPGSSVNQVYLGVELIPLLDKTFSEPQYDALGELLRDISERHRFIILSGAQLIGHEDLEPLSRWDSKGGWDPGALRAAPRFSWSKVAERII